MNNNNRKMYIGHGIAVLILASLACGSVQIGLVAPTLEETIQPSSDDQAPGWDLASLEEDETQAETQPAPQTASPTPEPETPTPQPAARIPTMAYLGQDGNIRILEAGSDTPRQLTFDANPAGGEGVFVVYESLNLSSDGTLLAYRQDVGTPVASGYDVTTGVWVINLGTGERHQVLDRNSYGFAWKPDTHLLAYGPGAEMDYFFTRGQPDPAFATGIRAFDVDREETLLLVEPERGLALSGPDWSPDGRFLAFSEVVAMEGSGKFAYYDLEAQEYVAWDDYLGYTSWSPDGSLLTYARHVYAASGEERLYLRPRLGEEQLLGPDYEGPAYATHPVFSPDGSQIAYKVYEDGPMTNTATVVVLDLALDEARPLGQFEGVRELAWTPDGSHLVFDFEEWESRQIMALNLADGGQTVLAEGRQPALAGP